ncbi:MAG TPA: metal ABC transporter substrate-binding protein [Tepidisphaeraceae bacterium]|nr:metal ABC transporter substrate-binding protein [Tepidisphaeraceae bacterium]
MRYAILATCIFATLGSAAHAKLKIVTTTTDFADLARQIGGDAVEVHSVMKGPENVHNVMARPTEMLKLNQADLFVHGGLDVEPWRDNLLKGSRNPRVMPGKPGNVDMSTGIELLDVPTGKIDRSAGDVHAYGNPHYQLSPAAAMRMVATLTRAMSFADAANAERYKQNATKLVNELADTHKALRDELAPYQGLKVVTFHPAWGYFAEAFGLTIAGTIEPKPGITPSPAQVRDLVERMKAQNVKIVIVETYSDQDLAAAFARRAGATLVVLPDHVRGTPEADSYQNLFRQNVRKLIEAAKSAGIEPSTQEAASSAR